MSEPTLWTKFTDFFGNTIIKTITEINMLMPDSILFGSLVLYFLTQNMAFGIFAVFLYETVISHKLISWVSAQSVGSSRSIDTKCRAGFKTPQYSVQRMFSHDSYPSYGFFSVSAIATYLMLATREFSNTMDAMGPEWGMRTTASYAFSGLVVATFAIARLVHCDSIGELLAALVFAVIVGFVFFHINKAVFGEESMNFLGLPYMVTKESQGSPIYVCSTEKQ